MSDSLVSPSETERPGSALIERVPRTAKRKPLPSWLRSTLSLTGLVIVWQILSSTGLLPEKIFPGPWEVLLAGWGLVVDGTLWPELLISLQRVSWGVLFGVGAAVIAASIAGTIRLGEDLIDPIAQVTRTLPWTGIAPLLIVWLGFDEPTKIVLIAFAVFFPVYLTLFSGIRSVDRDLIEVAKIVRLSRWQTVTRIVLPGALASGLSGLRYSLGLAWGALIFAEALNIKGGIGALMNEAQTYLMMDVLVFCLALYGVLGLLTNLIVRVLERVLLRWRSSYPID